MRFSVIVAGIVVMAGCSRQYTIYPYVALDEDFQGYELQRVYEAMGEWEDATPARFRVHIVSHADILTGAQSDVADVVMIRLGLDEPMPKECGPMSTWMMADTFFPTDSDHSTICFHSAAMLASDTLLGPGHSVYKAVVAHELGHTMGLVHAAATPAEPALMYWSDAPEMFDKPTCIDLVQFAERWPIKLPEECDGVEFVPYH
jgi:hypothetical protein